MENSKSEKEKEKVEFYVELKSGELVKLNSPKEAARLYVKYRRKIVLK